MKAIDVYLHISSFFDKAEPNGNNPVAEIFKRFPWLNPSEVAIAMRNTSKKQLKLVAWSIKITS